MATSDEWPSKSSAENLSKYKEGSVSVSPQQNHALWLIFFFFFVGCQVYFYPPKMQVNRTFLFFRFSLVSQANIFPFAMSQTFCVGVLSFISAKLSKYCMKIANLKNSPVCLPLIWSATFMNYKNTFNRLERLDSFFILFPAFEWLFSSGEIKSSEHFEWQDNQISVGIRK